MARHSLLIATTEHSDNIFSKLVAPENDVRALEYVLHAPEIGQFDSVRTLVNRTSQEIREEVEAFFSDRSRDDLLVLYFSGHGVLDAAGALHFVTVSTKRRLLSATAISAAFITEQVNRCRSQRQLIVLDCCHSGAFERTKGGTVVGTKQAFEGDGFGRIVLTATDATQFAWEDDTTEVNPASVFTRFLVEGLQTGAADADGDGQITVDELYDYTFKRVSESGSRQTPGKWTYRQQGNLVVARNLNPVARRDLLSPELMAALGSSIRWQKDAAIHELGRLSREDPRPGVALAAREVLRAFTSEHAEMLKLVESVLPRTVPPPPAPERQRHVEPTAPLTAAQQPNVAPVRRVDVPMTPAEVPKDDHRVAHPAPPAAVATSGVRAEAATARASAMTISGAPERPQGGVLKRWASTTWSRLALTGLAAGLGTVTYLFVRPVTGSVSITVTSAAGELRGTKVYLDDRVICDTTPCTSGELTPGAHQLRAVAENHQGSANKPISILRGRRTSEEIRLVQFPSLTVTGSPAGAAVFLDKKQIGTLPASVNLEPGRHEIHVEDGVLYQSVDLSVQLSAGESRTVPVALAWAKTSGGAIPPEPGWSGSPTVASRPPSGNVKPPPPLPTIKKEQLDQLVSNSRKTCKVQEAEISETIKFTLAVTKDGAIVVGLSENSKKLAYAKCLAAALSADKLPTNANGYSGTYQWVLNN